MPRLRLAITLRRDFLGSPVLARRVISLQSSASVAIGGRRTSSDRRGRLAKSRMTLCDIHVSERSKPDAVDAQAGPSNS